MKNLISLCFIDAAPIARSKLAGFALAFKSHLVQKFAVMEGILARISVMMETQPTETVATHFAKLRKATRAKAAHQQARIPAQRLAATARETQMKSATMATTWTEMDAPQDAKLSRIAVALEAALARKTLAYETAEMENELPQNNATMETPKTVMVAPLHAKLSLDTLALEGHLRAKIPAHRHHQHAATVLKQDLRGAMMAI